MDANAPAPSAAVEPASPPRAGERLFAALCLALSVPMTLMHLYGPSADKSDYVTHVELAEKLAAGELAVPHLVFHALVAALGRLLSIRAATVIVIAGFQVGLGLLVYRALFAAWRDTRATFAVSAALVLAAPISVLSFPHLFFGYFVTATYHNPTIQVLKPLALLLFLWTVKLLLAPRGGAARPSSRQWLLLGAIALVATLAKPSLSIVLPPALLIFWLCHLRTVDHRAFFTGAAVLGFSIAAVLTWEYLFLYGKDPDAKGIVWAPFVVWRHFEPAPHRFAVKLALSLFFPLTVAAYHLRRVVADREALFAWICFLVSFAYHGLLAEDGPRKLHGNFGWGVLVGLFLVFFSSARLLGRLPAEPRSAPSWFVPRAALGAHLACGIVWYCASAGWLGSACADNWGNWCW